MNPDNQTPSQPAAPNNPPPAPEPPTPDYITTPQPPIPTVQVGPTTEPAVEPPPVAMPVVPVQPYPQAAINPPSQVSGQIPSPQMPYNPPTRSKKPLLFALAAALILAIGGVAAYFMLSGSNDSADTTDTGDTDEAVGTAAPIEYAYELSPICEGSRALPSNVTFSTDSKVRVMAFQEQSFSPGSYSQASGLLAEQNRKDYDNETNIDAVACLDYTDQQLDTVVCQLEDSDGNPLSAQMLRFAFDLRVIDLKTMDEIGSDTVTATNECPMLIMVNADNEFDADADADDMASKIAEITTR